MSGLEIVGIVAGIVSAFSGAAALYRQWRKERKERDRQEANKRLKSLVKYGGSEVQDEYDRDFRRLGQLFSRGDDIGQNALLQQLVILQQTVISLLNETRGIDALTHLVHPNHERLYSSSVSVKANTLSALVQQAQRLLQTAPISPGLEPNEKGDSTALPTNTRVGDAVPPASLSSTSPNATTRPTTPEGINAGYNCFSRPTFSWARLGVEKWSCSDCNWEYEFLLTERVEMKSSATILMRCFLKKFHAGSGGSYSTASKAFRCFVCKTGWLFDWNEMKRHRLVYHTYAELCNKTYTERRCGEEYDI